MVFASELRLDRWIMSFDKMPQAEADEAALRSRHVGRSLLFTLIKLSESVPCFGAFCDPSHFGFGNINISDQAHGTPHAQ